MTTLEHGRKWSGSTLTLNHRIYDVRFRTGVRDAFKAIGATFLIHHSLCKSANSSAAVTANPGKWEVLTVKSVEFPTCDYLYDETFYLTFDKAPDIDLENFCVQAIYINECKDISLVSPNDTPMSPAPYYNKEKYCGGILALRINGTLTPAGGYLDLNDKLAYRQPVYLRCAIHQRQKCWNSYAAVKELTVFEVGQLVVIHQCRKSAANDYTDGDFKLLRITAISDSTVTIMTARHSTVKAARVRATTAALQWSRTRRLRLRRRHGGLGFRLRQ